MAKASKKKKSVALEVGLDYLQKGDLNQAEKIFQDILQKKSTNADAWHLWGLVALEQKKFLAAIERIQRAIKLNSNESMFHNNLGVAYQQQELFEQSITAFLRAIELKVDFAGPHNNLGVTLKALGRVEEAIIHYQRAIEINPGYIDAHKNLSFALLLLGEFSKGFLEYQYRSEVQKLQQLQLSIPQWDGEKDINGKSIVLWSGQGLGDAIYAVRYCSILKQSGANVVLAVQGALITLFQECLKDKFEIVDRDNCNINSYDYYSYLMSLPGIFIDTLINSYIAPPRELRAHCRLNKNQFYKIGIVWAGDKKNVALYKDKYCPVDLFSSLLDIQEVALYSLQVGEDASQLNDSRIVDLSPLIKDFVDTACLIAQLDLVITIDTAVAHLAGAMGKPVWVLLPQIPDWRWLLNRADSPWYPSMRLFRQTQRGNWQDVFTQVKEQLTIFVQNRLDLAINYIQANNLNDAQRSLQKVLEQQANNPDALHLLGVVYIKQKNNTQAINLIKKAIELKNYNPAFYNNLGYAYQQNKEYELAIESYQKATIFDPNFIDAYFNLSNIFKELYQLDESITYSKKTIQLKPDNAQAHFNLGYAYAEQDDLKSAIESYHEAINLQKDYSDAYNNLANIFKETGQLDLAIYYYQKAIEFSPNDADHHWNLGLILLLSGDFERGLKKYETRFNRNFFKQFAPRTPMWNGTPIRGKSIVLWNEQGLGDAIQFARYGLKLKEMGAKVTFAVQSSLVSLFQECLKEECEVFDRSSCNIYEFDEQISLLSLPSVFKTNLQNIPYNNETYIFPPVKFRSACLLPTSQSLKIGIVWASDRNNPTFYKSKSCPVDFFSSLLDIQEVALYSLQVGEDASQLNDSRIVDLSPLIKDFVDTACLIAQLDLVITIDTAVAHLAGAMGKPVWVLLPHIPDWRWLLNRQDSPWYSTMRLFRQPQRGNWQSVFTQVKEKLITLVNGESAIFGLENLQLGIEHLNAGRNKEAEKCFTDILTHRANNSDAWHLLGIVAAKEQDLPKAIERFNRAIELKPAEGIFYNSLANILIEQNQLEEAIKLYQKAIELKSNYSDAQVNLAQAYIKLGNIFAKEESWEQVIENYQQAIQIKPVNGETYFNLGYAYMENGQFEQAINAYQKAIELEPNNTRAYNNLANIFSQQKQLDKALDCYQQVIKIKPENAEVHWNIALLLLLSGDFERGFQMYQWRFGLETFEGMSPNSPMWDGCDLQGKNIVLWAEQGLGDVLQFVRYASIVKKHNAHEVILAVHPQLVSLFQECLNDSFNVVDIYTCDIYQYGYHAALLSLPNILQTTLANIPNTKESYISAPSPLRDKCILSYSRLYRIGIVWASAKTNTSMYKSKCCSPELFSCLLDFEGIELYSLQVGEDSSQLNDPRIVDLSPLIEDFVDTASFISQLDLVITVDTAVAHLAGAMGKQVWVLLPYVADWRWLLDRQDSPWYPTMRLFRQTTRGDWEGVFTQVKDNLKQTTSKLHLGVEYLQANQLEQAVIYFEQVLQEQPGNPDAWHLLGVSYAKQNNNIKAIEKIQKAIEINSNQSSFYNNLANIYAKLEQYDQAIECYQKAVQLKSDYLDAHLNLANLYLQKELINQAISSYKKVLEINPNAGDILNNLGFTYAKAKQFSLARQCFQKSIELQPSNNEAQVNFALLLLMLGNWTEGFLQYERRPSIQAAKWTELKGACWNGSDITGKSIVLWSEQGLGDTIQFIRYAQKVKEKGARVFLDVQSSLVSLFEQCLKDQFEYINSNDIDPNEYDEHISLVSLAHIFQTTPENIPNSSYIFPPEEIPRHCILPARENFRIGIVWGSDKNNIKLYKYKSCPVEFFISLLELPGFSFYSLQVGEEPSDPRIHNLSPLINDFLDTASFISQLDLVITVDTAVAHLAGAMGKQVWVLLPYVADWRWLLDRQDSPWYPTMRLFRQTTRGDWEGVFTQVKDNLKQTTSKLHLGLEAKLKEEAAYYNKLGDDFKEHNQIERAIASYQEAIKLNNEYIEAHYKLAIVYYKEQGLVEQAIEHLETVTQLKKDHVDAHYILGYLYSNKELFDKALGAYHKTLELKPNLPEAYYNIGVIYKDQLRLDRAIASYQKALELRPDYIDAHWNLGMVLLSAGELKRGFLEYEHRFKTEQSKWPNFQTPMWDGSDLKGKNIVLWNEQGLGDGIQFVRYAQLVKEKCSKVILCVQGTLIPLFQECLKGEFELVERNNCDIHSYDQHASLLSLPHIFGTSLETIPTYPQGYIHLTNNIRSHCKLNNTQQYKIGIVWSSEKSNITLYKKKYCPVEFFSSLLDLDQVALYSLQIGEDKDQLSDSRICDLSPLINDFVDTVCLISQLDLIVTIDTSVAHLAGAMGKPVWVLLPYVADWRWMLERQDSPWYPTMRLFRQTKPGDWQGVFNQLKTKLPEVIQTHKPTFDINNINLELGIEQLQHGKLPQAEQTFKWLIQLQPNNADAWNLLAVSIIQQGRIQEATGKFERAIELNPQEAIFYNNLGNAYTEQKQFEKAIIIYEKSIEIAPNYAEAYYNLGNALKELKQFEKAIIILKKAIDIKADYAFAYFKLGIIYKAQKEFEKAIKAYQKAIEIDPNYVDAYYNLGNIFNEQEELEKAIVSVQKCLEINPNYKDAYNNLGNIFNKQKQFQKAIKAYQKAIEIDPNYVDAHWNLSLVLLMLGDFKQGWIGYQWRFKRKEHKWPIITTPMWQGEDIKGKRIVLWNEQGLGDAIQFVRYARIVKAKGAQVILAVQTQLFRLFEQSLQEKYEIVDHRTFDMSAYDQHASLLSLPGILGTTLETIPDFSYIQPQQHLVLPDDDEHHRIGIVWGSDRRNWQMYKYKYCPVEFFASLLDLDQVALYSLQVGEDADQLNDSRIVNLSSLISDFADTASLIAQLDLIITVDTAVAHLAGAMGKPVWVVLPYNCDWRWLLDRQDSPWYPTMRLFRQTKPGDWQGVFNQVKEQLMSDR